DRRGESHQGKRLLQNHRLRRNARKRSRDEQRDRHPGEKRNPARKREHQSVSEISWRVNLSRLPFRATSLNDSRIRTRPKTSRSAASETSIDVRVCLLASSIRSATLTVSPMTAIFS